MKRNENGVVVPDGASPLPWKKSEHYGFPLDGHGQKLIADGADFYNEDDRDFSIHAANYHERFADIVRRLAEAVKECSEGNPFKLGGMTTSVAFDAAALWKEYRKDPK